MWARTKVQRIEEHHGRYNEQGATVVGLALRIRARQHTTHELWIFIQVASLPAATRALL